MSSICGAIAVCIYVCPYVCNYNFCDVVHALYAIYFTWANINSAFNMVAHEGAKGPLEYLVLSLIFFRNVSKMILLACNVFEGVLVTSFTSHCIIAVISCKHVIYVLTHFIIFVPFLIIAIILYGFRPNLGVLYHLFIFYIYIM